MKERNLSSLEWDIYNEIKDRSKLGLFTSVDYLSSRFNVCKRNIRRHVNNIRSNSTIQKIVLTDYCKGYKLMTDEEEFAYLERRKAHILKEFKQYWKDVERFVHNGQTRIKFTPYERDFYESILEEGNNEEE